MNAEVAPRKPEFLTPCRLEVVRYRAHMWRVCEPFRYYSAELGREIVVPVDYHTDLASIPRFFQRIIQVNGRHREAAVLHDFLCDYKKQFGLTQGQVDLVFREALWVLDVDFVEGSAMYKAVRAYQKTKAWLHGERY